jgi:hypothetical protein
MSKKIERQMEERGQEKTRRGEMSKEEKKGVRNKEIKETRYWKKKGWRGEHRT